MWLYFIPLYIAGALLILLAIFALLARVRGGKYMRPVIEESGVPWVVSTDVFDKGPLDLQAGVANDPQRAQAALSRLSASERRAYLEAAGQEGALPQPVNRQQRRAMEKMQRQQRRGR